MTGMVQRAGEEFLNTQHSESAVDRQIGIRNEDIIINTSEDDYHVVNTI